MDDLPDLVAFAKRLEDAVYATIAAGQMTGDLAAIVDTQNPESLETEAFIRAIASRL
jgi:isocitrate dehydrogenase